MDQHRAMKRILSSLMSACLLVSAALPLNAAQPNAQEPSGNHLRGQAVVLYQCNPSLRSEDPLAGYTVEQEFSFSQPNPYERSAAARDKIAVVSKEGMTTGELVASLKQLDSVKIAEPNFLCCLSFDPAVDDTFYRSQWGLGSSERAGTAIEAAWEIGTDGEEENVVAVLDTGVDYTHPDLAGAMWRNPGNLGLGGVWI